MEKLGKMKKVELKLCPIIKETDSIWDIVQKSPPIGWEGVFKQAEPELKDISDILERKTSIFYPKKEHVFRAFELTTLRSVRVVIFGQNPYIGLSKKRKGEPIDQGLCFSVDRKDSIPKVLNVIFMELEKSITDFKRPNHGDLKKWTQQGVLLCNACLTVDPSQPKSNGEIWFGFLRHVIDAILTNNKKCIFLLIGTKAQKLVRFIKNRGTTLIAPYPLTFNKITQGFIGCNYFKKINEHLGAFPIDWNLD